MVLAFREPRCTATRIERWQLDSTGCISECQRADRCVGRDNSLRIEVMAKSREIPAQTRSRSREIAIENIDRKLCLATDEPGCISTLTGRPITPPTRAPDPLHRADMCGAIDDTDSSVPSVRQCPGRRTARAEVCGHAALTVFYRRRGSALAALTGWCMGGAGRGSRLVRMDGGPGACCVG